MSACHRQPSSASTASLRFVVSSWFWLIGICFAFAPPLLLAAEGDRPPPPLLSPLELKRMSIEQLLAQPVTSVSRRPEAWSEAASNVFVIRNLPVSMTGASTLPELLRLAPNLFVAQLSSSEWAINARGFVRSNAFSNKLLVMIDGRTVYSPLFSNVFWDATSVFLPDLQQVEVISGPAGSTWGANAVNGVINIETKSARDTLGGLVFANVGTDVTAGGLRYGARLGEGGALRVYFQHSADEASRSAAGAKDDFDSWHATSGGFRADWLDPQSGEFTFSGDLFSGRYHNGPSPDTVNDGGNLLARWARDVSPTTHFWIRAFHDYSRRDNLDALTETTRTTDLEAQGRFEVGPAQEVIFGGDYRLIADTISHTDGFVVLPPELTYSLGSVFGQHEAAFFNRRLRTTTGLRLERNHFSGWEYEPNFRLAWVPPRQTVWFSASRATRIPSRLETGYNFPDTPPYIVVGGSQVRSETVDAYEVGWRDQLAKNASITTTVFFNNYDHLRSVEPTTPVTFANGVKGRSYGVEFFADWDIQPWWRLRVGGFRVNQETWLAPGGADLEHARGESSFPKYQLQLRDTFRFGRKLTLWTSLRHVAAVPTFESQVSGAIPAYTEFDATLSWAVNSTFDLSLIGKNLLHPQHPELGALAVQREIPRAVRAAATFRF